MKKQSCNEISRVEFLAQLAERGIEFRDDRGPNIPYHDGCIRVAKGERTLCLEVEMPYKQGLVHEIEQGFRENEETHP